MAKMRLTHIPQHSGKIRTGCGRVAEPGERITCPACKERLVEAQKYLAVYVRATHDDLAGNLPLAYANRGIDVEARHAGTMARNAFHYAEMLRRAGVAQEN